MGMTSISADARRLSLLIERTRLGIWCVCGSNVLFAFYDIFLPVGPRLTVWGIKILALSACAGGLWALRRCNTLRKAYSVVLLSALVAVLTTSISGIVTRDPTTTLLLCVLIAWGCAVLLPLRAVEQAPITILAVAASMANALAVRGHVWPDTDYPFVALVVGGASSVLFAYLFDKLRTRLWAAEDALAASEEVWRRRVEQAADFIAELDLSGTCLFASANHVELGYVPEDLVGRNALMLVHPDDRSCVTAALASITDRRTRTVVARFARADGEYRWLEITGHVFTTQDGSSRVVTVSRDITERREMELALQSKNRMLQESNRVKSYVAGTMAHELRNTFAAILSYLRVVRNSRGALPVTEGPDGESPLEVLQRLAQEGVEIIAATLELSRGESSPERATQDVVHLEEIFREIDQELPPDMRKSEVELRWMADGIPAFRTDAVKLKMVLRNLVINAMKFTARGNITVKATRANGGVEIRVSDTGPGIAPELLPQLFDPFTQGEGRRTRQMGAGLGMFIVRQLVDLLGGEIHVDSQPGRGSTFTVKLPVRAETEWAPAWQPEPALTPATMRPLRVLVAEDNKIIQLVVEHMLRGDGHAVQVVDNGRQALEALERMPFDAVLLDLEMPVLDGLAVARHLQRELPPERRPLLVAMTASEEEETREALRDAGVTALVPKPCDVARLRAVLAPLAGSEASESAA